MVLEPFIDFEYIGVFMKCNYKFSSVFATAFLCCVQVVFPQSEIKRADVEKLSGFSADAVVLKDSWIKDRERLNTEFLKSLDADRLLHNFRVNAGIPSDAVPLEGWEAPNVGLRGHFTGHFLSAVSRWVKESGDSLLKRELDYMVDALYDCRQKLGHGYLSAFPESDFDALEKGGKFVWAPYYTFNKVMQGLLDVYVYTGNRKAYDMVLGMADYVSWRMSRLSEEEIERMLFTVGANPNNEPGAMNEVLYKLYRVSGNAEHLKLAEIFDRDWFLRPLCDGRDVLSGLHANTHIAIVDGFAKRYVADGNKKYRKAVENFWNMLMKGHAYANGTSSGPRPIVVTPTSVTAEHWGKAGVLSNTLSREIAETCVSHNTQKLSSALFCWTENPMYADAYMNTFYNAVLPSQSMSSGRNVYHLPLGSPRNKKFLEFNDFRCCNGSNIEAFTSLNSSIYFSDGKDLWVNLYVPSELKWKEKKAVIEQAGDFPMDSVVRFSVMDAGDGRFAVNFLMPSWAKHVDVYVNGKKYDGKCSPLSFCNVRRDWKSGDEVELRFHYYFYIKTMPDDENVFAVFYGPSMLAFETAEEVVLSGSRDDVLKSLRPLEDGGFELENNGMTYRLKPLYMVDSESYGVYATLQNF